MLTRLALLSLSKGALHAIGRAKPDSAMSQVNVPGRLSKRGLQRLDSLLRQYGNGGIEPLDEEYGELVERLSDMNQQLDTESQEASTESARVAVEADLLSALALAVEKDVDRFRRNEPHDEQFSVLFFSTQALLFLSVLPIGARIKCLPVLFDVVQDPRFAPDVRAEAAHIFSALSKEGSGPAVPSMNLWRGLTLPQLERHLEEAGLYDLQEQMIQLLCLWPQCSSVKQAPPRPRPWRPYAWLRPPRFSSPATWLQALEKAYRPIEMNDQAGHHRYELHQPRELLAAFNAMRDSSVLSVCPIMTNAFGEGIDKRTRWVDWGSTIVAVQHAACAGAEELEDETADGISVSLDPAKNDLESVVVQPAARNPRALASSQEESAWLTLTMTKEWEEEQWGQDTSDTPISFRQFQMMLDSTDMELWRARVEPRLARDSLVRQSDIPLPIAETRRKISQTQPVHIVRDYGCGASSAAYRASQATQFVASPQYAGHRPAAPHQKVSVSVPIHLAHCRGATAPTARQRGVPEPDDSCEDISEPDEHAHLNPDQRFNHSDGGFEDADSHGGHVSGEDEESPESSPPPLPSMDPPLPSVDPVKVWQAATTSPSDGMDSPLIASPPARAPERGDSQNGSQTSGRRVTFAASPAKDGDGCSPESPAVKKKAKKKYVVSDEEAAAVRRAEAVLVQKKPLKPASGAMAPPALSSRSGEPPRKAKPAQPEALPPLIDDSQLLEAVTRQGGYEQVENKRAWSVVAKALGRRAKDVPELKKRYEEMLLATNEARTGEDAGAADDTDKDGAEGVASKSAGAAASSRRADRKSPADAVLPSEKGSGASGAGGRQRPANKSKPPKKPDPAPPTKPSRAAPAKQPDLAAPAKPKRAPTPCRAGGCCETCLFTRQAASRRLLPRLPRHPLHRRIRRQAGARRARHAKPRRSRQQRLRARRRGRRRLRRRRLQRRLRQQR